jgi:hypothetical protein
VDVARAGAAAVRVRQWREWAFGVLLWQARRFWSFGTFRHSFVCAFYAGFDERSYVGNRIGIVIYGRPLESKRFFDLRQGGFAVIKPHIHHFCKADDFRRRFEIAERVGVGMQVG